jgi:hypothetical protein
MTRHLLHPGPAPAPTAPLRTAAPPRAAAPPAARPVVRPAATVLTLVLAAVTTAASVPTLLVDGVLLGPAVMNGSARGTALVLLCLGVPALLGLVVAVHRAGPTWARRAFLAWVGTAAYVVYNAVMFVLGTPFNALFLLYEAMLGLGIATLVTLLAGLDPTTLAPARDRAPYRAVAAWVGFVAVGNTLVWLRMVVPALGDPAHAAFLKGTGLTTFPTHVQDLAFWLPLALVVAVWLWQRRAWGYVLGSALVVYYLAEAVGVGADQWMGSRADPASDVATMAGAYLFAVLAVVGVVPVVAMLRHPDGAAA